MTAAPERFYRSHVVPTIAELGYTTMLDGEDGRWIAYTIGATNDGLPELMTFCERAEDGPPLLEAMVQRLRRDPALLQGNVVSCDAWWEPVMLREVPPKRFAEYALLADRWHREHGTRIERAMQVLVADEQFRFPGAPW